MQLSSHVQPRRISLTGAAECTTLHHFIFDRQVAQSMARLSVTLDVNQKRKIAEVARAMKVSEATVMRWAVDAYSALVPPSGRIKRQSRGRESRSNPKRFAS
jgi:hypothetical protein